MWRSMGRNKDKMKRKKKINRIQKKKRIWIKEILENSGRGDDGEAGGEEGGDVEGGWGEWVARSC